MVSNKDFGVIIHQMFGRTIYSMNCYDHKAVNSYELFRASVLGTFVHWHQLSNGFQQIYLMMLHRMILLNDNALVTDECYSLRPTVVLDPKI
jgi:hypothetical protein